MVFNLLSIVALAATTLAIFGRYKNKKLHYFTKPLAILSIILIALILYPGNDVNYSQLIIAGLLFSMAGDVFLMFEERFFLFGLISFFITHVFYSYAFLNIETISFNPWLIIVMIVIAIIIGRQIIPRAGELKIPVTLYILVIMIMVWLSWERYLGLPDSATLMAVVGTSFFLISDTLLAWNKFVKKFESAEFFILLTYFTAQWFIAMSI